MTRTCQDREFISFTVYNVLSSMRKDLLHNMTGIEALPQSGGYCDVPFQFLDTKNGQRPSSKSNSMASGSRITSCRSEIALCAVDTPYKIERRRKYNIQEG